MGVYKLHCLPSVEHNKLQWFLLLDVLIYLYCYNVKMDV
jgi:hypothetical protein